jgi:hypothetical protein
LGRLPSVQAVAAGLSPPAPDGPPSWAERQPASSRRPSSGTRPAPLETACRAHSGAAGPPPAWWRGGGRLRTKAPVLPDRPSGWPRSASRSSSPPQPTPPRPRQFGPQPVYLGQPFPVQPVQPVGQLHAVLEQGVGMLAGATGGRNLAVAEPPRTGVPPVKPPAFHTPCSVNPRRKPPASVGWRGLRIEQRRQQGNCPRPAEFLPAPSGGFRASPRTKNPANAKLAGGTLGHRP